MDKKQNLNCSSYASIWIFSLQLSANESFIVIHKQLIIITFPLSFFPSFIHDYLLPVGTLTNKGAIMLVILILNGHIKVIINSNSVSSDSVIVFALSGL